MPLQAPNLDDRRYAELVAELRARIPRHAPEWTDHNDSDPGMTLVQLFSWLGEIILYRLNRVPDRNYLKFLELIGVERKPAVPAVAELTFSLASADLVTVFMPQGTQVSAEAKPAPPADGTPTLPPEDEESVVFETDVPLFAIGAQLTKVQVFDGNTFQDFTEANMPGGRSYPAFGVRATEGSALLLGFASNSAFPTEQLSLAVRLAEDVKAPSAAVCDLPEDKIHPPATVAWEYWVDNAWRPLDVIQDETRALTRSGYVNFRGPKNIQRTKLGLFTKAEDKELFWLRCRLAGAEYEKPPEVDAVLTNTVRATAVTTVRGEVLGSSNGQPDQLFRLRHAPIHAKAVRPVEERLREQATRPQPPNEAEQADLDARLRERELLKGFLLEVEESRGLQPWEEVEDFYQSAEADRHYTLNRATGEVRFGNGVRGAIPLAGVSNIVCRFYRYGGGKRGNVGSGTINGLLSSAPGLDQVTNHYPAENGADEEPIEDTKQRAPKELKARDRAVTVQDFEFLARQTPGVRVRRAHALALHHPQFPGVKVPGAITVVVIPESDNARPMPSEGTLETVCAYLNQRRLLTTEVFVAAPKYKQVKIEATVIAAPTADPATVKSSTEAALRKYLHPLTGGADEQGWELGQAVLYSEVFRVVLQVEGVQQVQDMRIVVEGQRFGRCDDAPIPPDHLVFSESHEVKVLFAPSTI